MTPGGWLIMLGSLAFVWGLAGWCFYKVLTAPPENRAGEPSASPGV